VRLRAHRYNRPAQIRIFSSQNAWAEAEKKLPKNPVRVDSKKILAKGNEAGNVENGIWRELVKLHAIDKKKPMKKLMGRKRKATEKKS
jgi:hypothetical protein